MQDDMPKRDVTKSSIIFELKVFLAFSSTGVAYGYTEKLYKVG